MGQVTHGFFYPLKQGRFPALFARYVAFPGSASLDLHETVQKKVRHRLGEGRAAKEPNENPSPRRGPHFFSKHPEPQIFLTPYWPKTTSTWTVFLFLAGGMMSP